MDLSKFKHFDIIKSEIGELKKRHTHFWTEGRWSSHELLLYILSITGKTDVFITSFGISEQFLRAVNKAKDLDYINSVSGLFNVAVRRNKTDLMFFASNIFDEIFTGNFHQKIFLIRNDNYSIIVNQSANATPNPAHESGVICTDIQIYNLYQQKINFAKSKAILLNKHDIYGRKTNRN